MNDRPLVLYHGSCPDGFGAAWVAHRHLGDGADYMPMQYGYPLPQQAVDRDIFLFDFCFDRETTKQLVKRNRLVQILDHHKTAEAALVGLEQELAGEGFVDVYIKFDMNKSGVGLAWGHFFTGHPAPWVVSYTEDRDLWRWALPQSKEVNAYLGTIPMDFHSWDVTSSTCDAAMAAERGTVALAKTQHYVDVVAQNAMFVTLWDHGNIPLVNAPQVGISELLNKLAEDHRQASGLPYGIAIGWFQRADGMYQYSLRSVGDFDVSAKAKEHGGGGHKNAAGFQNYARVW